MHQRPQGALGVDHPRDEVQRGPRRDHELCGKEKEFFGTQLKAMEVDNDEEMGEQVWWGGSEPWYGDGWEVSSGGEVCQMHAYWGKGLWQEKVSKGKG